ncbi:ABC transporter ATP-binding protein [Dolosigranulum savutiense]|uniref:ABC transporter ATP-binding protein n=1 Tax=Dolosigranulum savutiense TaxID=3110288 RepID=A0AB74TKK2_9LACT
MEELIRLEDLNVSFATTNGYKPIIKGINLSIQPGEIVGLVGESGSGKSVTARSIVRLNDERTLTDYTGAIYYKEDNILDYSPKQLRQFRQGVASMVFQDPMSSLNPLMTIGKQLTEAIRMADTSISQGQAREKALDLMNRSGLRRTEQLLDALPHELSGGMQQRIMIAIALAKDPVLLIADEATTALDVTIQAQILDLFKEIQQNLNTAFLFITHDLTIAQALCDRIVVMKDGHILEVAPTETLFTEPLHPYTLQLFSAIPGLKQPQREHIQRMKEEAQQKLSAENLIIWDLASEQPGVLSEVTPGHELLVQHQSNQAKGDVR